MQDTHFSLFPRQFSLSSFPALQTIFTPFFVVQFHAFQSQLPVLLVEREFGVCSFASRLPLVESMMLIACNLHGFHSYPQFSWLDVSR